MLLIRPVKITPAMILSSNAGAADPDYQPAATYTLGQRVYLPADGYTYECVQAPSVGQYPPTSPLNWMRAEPSNRWAMWDTEISTSTQVVGDLVVTLAMPQRINALSLHGLVGSSITVVQTDSAGEVLFTEARTLRGNPSGWYAYFYEERIQSREAVFTGLVPASGGRFEVTISGASTACAAVLIGNAIDIGDAQYGFSTGIVDYSRKTTSATGVQSFEPGRYSKRMSGTLVLERARYNAISAALEGVRATPCAWIGVPDSGDYEPMTMLGVYRDFSIELSYPSHHICSLEVESLT